MDKLSEIELIVCTDFTKLEAQHLVWLIHRVKALEYQLGIRKPLEVDDTFFYGNNPTNPYPNGENA
ncbi:MAG: hypothetical protein BWY19_00776 [bacterium ADurb.Bin212]|nr:MAG: hypothetical protein BWY19_00776 [bacterium ADurb.Bin212]